jgi:gamma-glutamyltranspeptidase/glutathione hydrolase
MPQTFGRPAYSADGVVATPHYLASLAGIDVLRDGGSAVDAAIAANMVLGVVWPHMCGPGGDLFAQVWHAPEKRLFGLNASGRAGSGMSLEAYQARGLTHMPSRGVRSVTVPGAVGGWFALHQRFGRLEMRRLARDAIHHARDGYRLTPYTSAAIKANAELLAQVGGGAAVFLPDGKAPGAGDRLLQPDLARTLERIADEGPDLMYRGQLGERIVEFLVANGGGLQAEDFAAHASEWVEPLSVDYRGVRVFELPPNTQGLTLLQMLNMLSREDLAAWGQASAELVHQLVERKKLAFADRDAFVADPAYVPVPVERLLDPSHAAELSARVSRRAAESQPTAAGRRAMAGDTVFLCAADRDGTVVSLIQSLYSGFGSGVHVPGTGVTLHNRGFGFVLTPGHPNALAPGKRPMHTLMPGFALQDGQPWLAFGTRGADGQPQTGLQILCGLLDWQVDQGLQATMEAPRWVHGAPGGRYPAEALVLESRFGQAVADDLSARGHQVMLADPVDPVMGTVQLIQIDRQRGCYIASSDPRGDGVALAL